MIRIENLSVSYKETLALKDISLVLHDQQLPASLVQTALGNQHY